MFGLIKQLAKLITIAKNLPKIPPLVTQLTKPEDIALTLAMGMVGDDIDQMVQSNSQNLNEITQSLEQTSQERIQEVQDSTASEEVKQQEISRINQERIQQISQITEGSSEAIKSAVEQKVQDKAKSMEPAIQAALAPLLALIGIPSAIVYLIDKISGASKAAEVLSTIGSDISQPNSSVSNPGVTSADDAEAAFNSDINSAEAAAGADGGYPVGSTIVDKEVLLTFSQVEDPTFEYDENGVAIPRLNLFVKDEDVKDNPNYNLTLKSYGVNFPSNQKDRVTYFISENGEITINWRYASIDTNISNPRFDSSITFEVGGDKINRRRFFPDGTTRARNTFVIPIRFASTYPEQ
tara:strand:- start:540 stop:1595 length:1056 start_codon:yes stop_codon:yes gene_type:complete